VRVVVMVMAMVVAAGGKNRSGKHQQEQGGSKYLFHARTVARILCREKILPEHASSQTTGGPPIGRQVAGWGEERKTEQAKNPARICQFGIGLPRIGLSRPKCHRTTLNRRPGQHAGSPVGKNHRPIAEQIDASPRNRCARSPEPAGLDRDIDIVSGR
jgi:hypothetical protein